MQLHVPHQEILSIRLGDMSLSRALNGMPGAELSNVLRGFAQMGERVRAAIDNGGRDALRRELLFKARWRKGMMETHGAQLAASFFADDVMEAGAWYWLVSDREGALPPQSVWSTDIDRPSHAFARLIKNALGVLFGSEYDTYAVYWDDDPERISNLYQQMLDIAIDQLQDDAIRVFLPSLGLYRPTTLAEGDTRPVHYFTSNDQRLDSADPAERQEAIDDMTNGSQTLTFAGPLPRKHRLNIDQWWVAALYAWPGQGGVPYEERAAQLLLDKAPMRRFQEEILTPFIQRTRDSLKQEHSYTTELLRTYDISSYNVRTKEIVLRHRQTGNTIARSMQVVERGGGGDCFFYALNGAVLDSVVADEQFADMPDPVGSMQDARRYLTQYAEDNAVWLLYQSLDAHIAFPELKFSARYLDKACAQTRQPTRWAETEAIALAAQALRVTIYALRGAQSTLTSELVVERFVPLSGNSQQTLVLYNQLDDDGTEVHFQEILINQPRADGRPQNSSTQTIGRATNPLIQTRKRRREHAF